MIFPQRTWGRAPVWRLCGGLALAWLTLGGARAHAACDGTAESVDEIQECIDADMLDIEWLGMRPDPTDGYQFLDLDEKTVELRAGSRPLPLMGVGGGGSLRIHGGRVVTPLGGLPSLAENTVCPQMSNFYIRVYGDRTQLVMDGTQIEVDPIADGSPEYPTTVVEVRPRLSISEDPVDVGASVELHRIVAREQTPLPHALVLTGYDPSRDDDSGAQAAVVVNESLLFVGSGAVIHDDVWTRDPEASPESRVELALTSIQSRWDATDAANAAVGVQIGSANLAQGSLAFARASDQLIIKSSRFSRLRTQNLPLFAADELVLDGVMVDDLEDSVATDNPVLVGDARNVFVQSSLMCDLRGTESAFRGWYGDGKKGSVYVLNSALWQTDLSLFSLRQHDGASDAGSGLVAANLTLHRSTQSGRQRLTAYDEPAFPNLVLLNTYLQGPWELNDVDGRARVRSTVAGDVDDGSVCGPLWNDGCTTTADALLMPEFLEANCSDVMDTFEAPLRAVHWYPRAGLDEPGVVSGGLYGLWSDPLRNLSAALFTAEERPALPMVDETAGGVSWRFPDEYGDWSDFGITCDAAAYGTIPRIGAWSAEPNDSCSLTLLVPYGDEEQVEQNPPDGLFDGDGVLYGFAPGCRYSGAAVVLFLPLGLRRRRERNAS